MNKIIAVVIGILVILGIWFFVADDGPDTTSLPSSQGATVGNNKVSSPTVQSPAVKEFSLTGEELSFSVPEIRVKTGDLVRVIFQSVDAPHDFRLDEFVVATRVLAAGESETIEFMASRPGIFEYYCSVGNHHAHGMIGTLIVE